MHIFCTIELGGVRLIEKMNGRNETNVEGMNYVESSSSSSSGSSNSIYTTLANKKVIAIIVKN